MTKNGWGRRDGWIAVLIAGGLFVIYNSNGREIASFDSQPTKFAARELLLRGTLSLNHVVGTSPALLDRHAFVLTADGRVRSAYSPMPSLLAAALTWPFHKTRVIDIRAPRAPNLMAALTASLLIACAAGMLFLVARQRMCRARAGVLALAVGIGTGLWHTASQTLWQHETAIFGLSLALLGFVRDRGESRVGSAILIGVGLALAGTSRFQLSPAIAILLAGTLACAGLRSALLASSVVAAAAAILVATNVKWFGHPLGAMPLLLAQQPTIHARIASFGFYPDAMAGLLVSPSRGLFVFAPVVAIALAGFPAAFRERFRSPLAWCAVAAIVQYLFYGSYAIWWGGHTYGPRYMLDLLPLLVPVAAVAHAASVPRLRVAVGSAALAWSVAVAGIGAFFHPNGNWNTDPVGVDRHHERLWDWRDLQIVRCLRAGPSPQNFNLFNESSFRRPGP